MTLWTQSPVTRPARRGAAALAAMTLAVAGATTALSAPASAAAPTVTDGCIASTRP